MSNRLTTNLTVLEYKILKKLVKNINKDEYVITIDYALIREEFEINAYIAETILVQLLREDKVEKNSIKQFVIATMIKNDLLRYNQVNQQNLKEYQIRKEIFRSY